MIIPIRCFTCGGVLANLWEYFKRETKDKGRKPKEVFDELNLSICCRRHLTAHVDIIDDL